MENLSFEEASGLEKHLIEKFQLQNPSLGYNIKEGGTIAPSLSAEGLKSLHDHFYGGKSPVARPVVLFDPSTGVRLMRFSCLKDCALYIGCSISTLSRHCSSRRGTVVGYICHYEDEISGMEVLPPEMRYLPRSQRTRWKMIDQYDLSGHHIKTYPSITEASSATGIPTSEISAAASGKLGRASYGGFQWRYHLGEAIDIEPVRKRGELTRGKNHYKARKILQLDKDTGQIIREFGSLADAVREVPKCHYTALSRALKGVYHTCAGYKWKYKE